MMIVSSPIASLRHGTLPENIDRAIDNTVRHGSLTHVRRWTNGGRDTAHQVNRNSATLYTVCLFFKNL